VQKLEEPETPEMTIKQDACALRAGLLRLNTQTHVQNIEHLLLSAAKRFRQRARILRLFPDWLSFECYGGGIIYLHLHISQCLFFFVSTWHVTRLAEMPRDDTNVTKQNVTSDPSQLYSQLFVPQGHSNWLL